MEAKVDEIADGVYRISAYVPEIAPPQGFTYNHFLVLGDEPLLFHTGLRRMFPVYSRRRQRQVLPAQKLRWICFGHYEADECGAMNEWLAAAPHAESHARPNRVPRIAQRHGRSDAANSGRWGGRRSRPWQARSLYRHAAHSARMGRWRPARGKHGHAALRRPFYPDRRRARPDLGRHCRSRDRNGGPVPLLKSQSRHGSHNAPPRSPCPTLRSPSCTGPPTPETAPQPCARLRTTTTGGCAR